MAARPLKPLRDLSPAMRNRIRSWAARHNLPVRQVSRSRELRRAATGHQATPRTPSEALRRPDVYPAYVARHTRQLAEQAGTDTGRRQLHEALLRQADTRGPITPIAPATVDPGQYERRRTFPSLADAQEYADVPYGTNMLIWPEGPDTWSVWARKSTR